MHQSTWDLHHSIGIDVLFHCAKFKKNRRSQSWENWQSWFSLQTYRHTDRQTDILQWSYRTFPSGGPKIPRPQFTFLWLILTCKSLYQWPDHLHVRIFAESEKCSLGIFFSVRKFWASTSFLLQWWTQKTEVLCGSVVIFLQIWIFGIPKSCTF